MEIVNDVEEDFVEQSEQFSQLLDDAKKLLYANYKKFTMMLTLVRLYKLKACNRYSKPSFTKLLGLIKELLPEQNELPKTLYEANKVMRSLGWWITRNV